MKLEIMQSIGIRQKCEQLLDAMIGLIVRVTDYVVYKHITLAEFSLFGFSGGRAIWFVFYGVENANFDYYFRDTIWTGFFLTATIIHLVGFFAKSCNLRLAAIYGYAFVWGVLTFLAGWSGTHAPAVPAFLWWFLMSFIVTVRLNRSKKIDGSC